METPDMAKENNFLLREAAKTACDGYYTHLAAGGKGDPAEERWIEALTAGADAITQVAVLESRLAQVERERDAAVNEWKRTKMDSEGMCWTCKHGLITDVGSCRCVSPFPCDEGEEWEWRGVCPENTKEG